MYAIVGLIGVIWCLGIFIMIFSILCKMESIDNHLAWILKSINPGAMKKPPEETIKVETFHS